MPNRDKTEEMMGYGGSYRPQDPIQQQINLLVRKPVKKLRNTVGQLDPPGLTEHACHLTTVGYTQSAQAPDYSGLHTVRAGAHSISPGANAC